ncbi:SDR family NAD(P)-dependent oxidoreductase [Nakamurella leprariae]|uniref:SDR family oxidoreductase n=1 Tax=Nakamurella leprariae TaxID=2803911 RepID=A0A938YGU8_9ACTN|nr:SDR family NAD(P)-dependent oxidoreductase [Nakamurella leprariae]MBM9468127.1 SDR family oxidoreductase [Nakamurella leprariae]
MTGPSSPSVLFDVRNKGAVVTGAASGLGFAIARVLARNGARVLLVDAVAETLDDATAELAGEGLAVRSRLADVRDRAVITQVMTEAAEWDGGLDILFANAGISSGLGRRFGNLVEDVDDQRWRDVLEVNLTGTLTTVRAGAARMNDGGRIIVTSSVAGLAPDPLVGYAYSSSKAAVTLFAQNVAAELAPRGINVNVLAPGSFLTPIGARNPDNGAMLAALTAATASGRMADPAEIEGTALLLASPAASHITGAVFVVDGGVLVARHAPAPAAPAAAQPEATPTAIT